MRQNKPDKPFKIPSHCRVANEVIINAAVVHMIALSFPEFEITFEFRLLQKYNESWDKLIFMATRFKFGEEVQVYQMTWADIRENFGPSLDSVLSALYVNSDRLADLIEKNRSILLDPTDFDKHPINLTQPPPIAPPKE